MNNGAQNSFRLLPKSFINTALKLLEKVSSFFIKLKVTPNAISIFALLAGIGAGFLFAFDHFFWAGILIAICGFFDIMDGKVAKKLNKKSLFGAIFDSTLDRYSEFCIYFGLAVHFRSHWALWIIFWTFLGSAMVSYTRARAEGLGIECKIGVMQRAERMILLVAGTFAGLLFKAFDPIMAGVLGVIALVSNFTALQRTFYIRKFENQLNSRKKV